MKPLLHRLLPQLVAGRLPVWVARRLHARLAVDEELAHAYDALRRAERGQAPLSSGQRDLLEQLVLSSATAEPQTSKRAIPVMAGAFAAASLAIFVFVQPSTTTFGLGELAARGDRLANEPLGVKVACVNASAQLVDTATAGARQRVDRLHCPVGSMMAFSTTNMSTEVRHIFVVGIGRDGSPRWYAPFSRDATSTTAKPGDVDAVLPTLADTKGMDDTVALHVLISDQPFDAGSIDRQLDAAARSGTPLGALEKLPLVNVPLQARIDLAH